MSMAKRLARSPGAPYVPGETRPYLPLIKDSAAYHHLQSAYLAAEMYPLPEDEDYNLAEKWLKMITNKQLSNIAIYESFIIIKDYIDKVRRRHKQKNKHNIKHKSDGR